MKRLLLVLALGGCGSNPFSDAKEWCGRISAAEREYFDRCELEPNGPMLNCDKVWGTNASEDQLRACVDALNAAECGTLGDWPPACPKVGIWTRLPWN